METLGGVVLTTDPLYDVGKAAPATLTPKGRLRTEGSSVDGFGNPNYPNGSSRLVSSAASTNAKSVKATAGRIFTITGFNSNAAVRYLKLYNTTGVPNVGTDVPVWTEYLAPQSKFLINLEGFQASNGIGYAFTVNVADNDATAVGAGDIMAFNLGYS